MAFAIELLNITKRFPGVTANDNVSVQVEESEIHGLLGENGAGKSTIMNILYGMSKPDEGILRLYGREVEFHSPMDAIRQGIGMVHQHFKLMPDETVLRNIILGWTPGKGLVIDEKKAVKDISEIMDKYGLKVNLKAKVNQISVGEKQRVEIIKALYRKVRILILDEPTAVLTPAESTCCYRSCDCYEKRRGHRRRPYCGNERGETFQTDCREGSQHGNSDEGV